MRVLSSDPLRDRVRDRVRDGVRVRVRVRARVRVRVRIRVRVRGGVSRVSNPYLNTVRPSGEKQQQHTLKAGLALELGSG